MFSFSSKLLSTVTCTKVVVAFFTWEGMGGEGMGGEGGGEGRCLDLLLLILLNF